MDKATRNTIGAGVAAAAIVTALIAFGVLWANQGEDTDDQAKETTTTSTSGSTTTSQPPNDTDPDESVRVSVSDGSVQEGNLSAPSNKFIPFDVTLSKKMARDVAVNYETVQDTATTNEDYSGESSARKGPIVIPQGQLSARLRVFVRRDDAPELDEQFFLTLLPSEGTELDDASAVGTIVNDD